MCIPKAIGWDDDTDTLKLNPMDCDWDLEECVHVLCPHTPTCGQVCKARALGVTVGDSLK